MGYYVRPTVFADVENRMSIAQQVIFGPVLSINRFDSEEEAVRIANDTPYGLAAYLQTGDAAQAARVAGLLRAGAVHVNGSGQPFNAPYGGYKMSGNGREGGLHGLLEFTELKYIGGLPASRH